MRETEACIPDLSSLVILLGGGGAVSMCDFPISLGITMLIRFLVLFTHNLVLNSSWGSFLDSLMLETGYILK